MTEVLVTVTYGRRWRLLRQSLASSFREGVERAIVVANGPCDTTAEALEAEFGGMAQLVQLEQNTGSAGGFAAGLEAAVRAGAENILLLDDDNTLEPGAMQALRGVYAELCRQTPPDSAIALCYRTEQHFDVASGTTEHSAQLLPDSFLCFHLALVPVRLWRLLHRRRRTAASPVLPPIVERAVAPYGGMYFHRSLVERHGLPEREMVLYADDIQFSYRVTSGGGKIWLATGAGLADVELSWNARKSFGSGLEALLLGDSAMRAYYNCRNYNWFETRFTCRHPQLRRVNRMLCRFYLWQLARRCGAMPRYRLLLRAMEDGEAGRLGVNPEFPLP